MNQHHFCSGTSTDKNELLYFLSQHVFAVSQYDVPGDGKRIQDTMIVEKNIMWGWMGMVMLTYSNLCVFLSCETL